MVEMHWAFTRQYWPVPLDLAHVWARPALVALAGTSVSTFPPEELLFILCVHGSKERWTLLKWVCDVAALLHTHQILDWGRVMEQARTAGGVRMLLLGLSLAHALLGATLPQDVVHRIQAAPVVHATGVASAGPAVRQSSRPARGDGSAHVLPQGKRTGAGSRALLAFRISQELWSAAPVVLAPDHPQCPGPGPAATATPLCLVLLSAPAHAVACGAWTTSCNVYAQTPAWIVTGPRTHGQCLVLWWMTREDDTGKDCTNSNGHPQRMAVDHTLSGRPYRLPWRIYRSCCLPAGAAELTTRFTRLGLIHI
jgi:putative nucleotidyltransferase-like protein